MNGQYNRLVWCINTRTIPRCFGETKMASNNENGIGHLHVRALVPWLMMMMMMMTYGTYVIFAMTSAPYVRFAYVIIIYDIRKPTRMLTSIHDENELHNIAHV